MRKTFAFTFVLAVVVFGAQPAKAQDTSRNYHVEFTATYWPLSPAGNIRTDAGTVDLESDLGVQKRKGHPEFGLVLKPGRKHGILFEAVPYRFKGANTISRSFEFGGRTFQVQDQISSETKINYFFGGYQYDIVSRPRGHAGVRIGVAYFDGRASATSLQFGSGSEEAKVPLPLIGGQFRAFPIPDSDIFNINGEVKGMSAGSYGHYVHANFNGGFRVVRHLRLQAGFSVVDMDVHEKDRSQGFKLRFTGPVFSVQLHD